MPAKGENAEFLYQIVQVKAVAYDTQPQYGTIKYPAVESILKNSEVVQPRVPSKAVISKAETVNNLAPKNKGVQAKFNASFFYVLSK